VRRAEMLAELMRLKYGIAVAGTHGKTTTTSLVGAILVEAGLDPTVIVGGRLRVTGTGARLGASDYLVVEADEFDRSFLTLAPILAVITNVDRDHLDTYADLGEIGDAFVAFASRVPFFGQVIACADDPTTRAAHVASTTSSLSAGRWPSTRPAMRASSASKESRSARATMRVWPPDGQRISRPPTEKAISEPGVPGTSLRSPSKSRSCSTAQPDRQPPHTLGRGKGCLSKTTALRPARASVSAAAHPAGPAPIMATS